MGKLKTILPYSLDECVLCKSPNVQIHHVIYGVANRKLSDKYGLIVALCQEHHTGDTGVHQNHNLDIQFKKLAQKCFEREYGANKSFLETFGRNYL